MCGVFILHKKTCQHLKVLHNLANQYFSNDEYTMLQTYIRKRFSHSADRLRDFNVTE
jgi:hypothetical protein